ncbi:MAG: 30S ribosomal protein S16 [Bacteroidales bacterium]|nr:30S ribosomal protein S16 [Bacteroidales bacterium]
MPVKIRLTRQGRKKLPFYHIVVADSRAPRDGRFIERIGSYNPVTKPATIELNFDRALYWVQQGAQPTDTCRSLLSEKGVMLKKHLLGGVKKGALTVEQADAKLEAWLKDKDSKLRSDISKLEKAKADDTKKRIEAESKIKEARAEELAKKLAAQAASKAKEEEAEAAEESTEATEAPADEAKEQEAAE